jgi:hypothetical protein
LFEAYNLYAKGVSTALLLISVEAIFCYSTQFTGVTKRVLAVECLVFWSLCQCNRGKVVLSSTLQGTRNVQEPTHAFAVR